MVAIIDAAAIAKAFGENHIAVDHDHNHEDQGNVNVTKKYHRSWGKASGRESGDAGSRLDQHIWLLRPGHPRHPLPVKVTADLVTMSIVDNILPGLP